MMRKMIIGSAMTLSLLTLAPAVTALPAHAATSHHAAFAAGEDGDDATPPPPTVPSSGGGGGGGGTPSGGASTGGGGMADLSSNQGTDAALWLASGGAGLGLLGAGAIARRRRAVTA